MKYFALGILLFFSADIINRLCRWFLKCPLEHLGMRLAGWRLREETVLDWSFTRPANDAPVFLGDGVVEIWTREPRLTRKEKRTQDFLSCRDTWARDDAATPYPMEEMEAIVERIKRKFDRPKRQQIYLIRKGQRMLLDDIQ